ncbi:MAG TPA: ketol-acid reductoisomerase [bacterium]|nr:ketol-acid reductoisomerase [bacterium]HPQ18169.1 ketol-acid reductoisomerase [bacterium]
MAKIYYDKDVKPDVLKNKTIAILGYGSQGHAHSLNLRDSGFNVIVAEIPESPNYEKAKKVGFEVMSAEEAAKKADVIVFTLPDPIHPIVYKSAIEKNLAKNKVLVFAHGFNIRYFQIVPPEFVDVIMVAPKGPGHLVRSEYMKGMGVPNLIAIHQDYSGKAKDIALAYSYGIGGTRAGTLETTFSEETETDLFGEQTVLCGGIMELILAGFETLVEAGYQPEVAYFECCHELKLIIDLIYEGGLSWMYYSVSDTAEYGGYTVGPKVINEESRKAMKEALRRVQNGEFAKEWIIESKVNYPLFKSLRAKLQNHQIEKVGAELRKMMPWIKRRETETGGK